MRRPILTLAILALAASTLLAWEPVCTPDSAQQDVNIRYTKAGAEERIGTSIQVDYLEIDRRDDADPQVFEAFWSSGDILLVKGYQLTVPFGACDDSTDCSQAIEDSCDAIGSSASSTVFLAESKSCSGRCADGTKVDVVCVTAATRIIVDDGAPI